mgnify:CR=1 FL=1
MPYTNNRIWEYDLRYDNKLAWKIVNKYSGYLERDVLSKIENPLLHEDILANLYEYNRLLLIEFKSEKILYKNLRFHRVWVDTYNTIVNNIKGRNRSPERVITSSVRNLNYTTIKNIKKISYSNNLK